MPAHVLYVAPFYSANILQCLDALTSLPDVRIGLITHESEATLPERYRGRVVGHYQVRDCLDAEQLVSAGKAFQAGWGRVDRLIGFLEQMQTPLAVARDKLGIPGMTEAIARNFREKNRMKAKLREAGLPVARQALIGSAEEARAFVREVGYPVVLKPPAGLGSRATVRATDDESLASALAELFVTPSNPAQAEEFVRGEEHTFETITIDGRPVWHSSSYYLPGPLQVLENPWIQYCVLLPREQLQPHAQTFRALNVRALQALGVGTALTHMEWFLRPDGSMVISEVAARPPGVHLMPMMGLCHGVDMWQKWAELMVFDRFEAPPRQFAAGTAFFRGQGPGQVVRAVEGLAEAQEQAGPWVVDRKLPQVGQPRASGYEGEGYAIVKGETTEEVVTALRALVKSVRVVLG
ncbi:ATP-grasp domain-containing protein [Nannocystis bainbridge]|uniref:ATP-grasp domain-containing protein n=1 Tax=Nannocystis bainbridge TaxID=2995303 RepID=A0ABT5E507_9BACT|nr:ATP-grasp domain-containing protein [Nannocystis bainbridge]MDC0720018.1 ATP-grasp domain-containing protein [Nannocystis bainbridge]